MEAHGTPAPRRAHARDSTPPRRITLAGHLFLCYDQRFDKYSVVVIDGHLLHLSTSTYRIFLALLERAVHPEPDAILPLDELLAVARLGPDEAAERRALRPAQAAVPAALQDRGPWLGHRLRARATRRGGLRLALHALFRRVVLPPAIRLIRVMH